jgi:hypothetical protein
MSSIQPPPINPADIKPPGILMVILPAVWMAVFPVSYSAVILFAPSRELTKRLVLLILGMLALTVLNEISKLNLRQYLQAPRASIEKKPDFPTSQVFSKNVVAGSL